MTEAIVEIPFQTDLLQQIDRFVAGRFRTRAEFIVEAAGMYLTRQQNWQQIFSEGDRLAPENHLSEADVTTEIKAFRRGQ